MSIPYEREQGREKKSVRPKRAEKATKEIRDMRISNQICVTNVLRPEYRSFHKYCGERLSNLFLIQLNTSELYLIPYYNEKKITPQLNRSPQYLRNVLCITRSYDCKAGH